MRQCNHKGAFSKLVNRLLYRGTRKALRVGELLETQRDLYDARGVERVPRYALVGMQALHEKSVGSSTRGLTAARNILPHTSS